MIISVIRYQGFYSKYPFKNFSRKNKEILYEGAIDLIPDNLKDHIPTDESTKEHRFCVLYKKIEKS